ncbi:hypothetical protein SPHINGOR109_60038 [Sphingorhabdus sp. 109]|nr:hypothetical protein SPHINGOR109_60038 [Sphingorhabdus sp. 109]
MVVLLERIELSTSSLPMTRSTTELQQPDHFEVSAPAARPGGFDRTDALRPNACDLVKRSCVFPRIMQSEAMPKPQPKSEKKRKEAEKAERLAAQLRANLRLRKAQAKQMGPDEVETKA